MPGRRLAAAALASFALTVGCSDDGTSTRAPSAPASGAPTAAPVSPADGSPAPDWTAERITAVAGLSPLPATAPPDPTNRWSASPAAAALGRALLDDPRVSATGRRACTSCHVPERAWQDGVARADPVLGDDSLDLIDRNTPTLLNVGFQRWFFWGGGADTLWGATIRHVEDTAVLGGTRLGLVQLVGSDPDLRGRYERAFGAWPLDLAALPAEGRPNALPVFHPHREAWDTLSEEQAFEVDRTAATIGKAVDAALRELVAPPTRFDAFVAELAETGGSERLTPSEQRGLLRFVEDGCARCHAGPAFSDGGFHDVDLRTVEGRTPDWGRFRGLRALLDDAFTGRGVHGDASPFHPRNRQLADLPTDPDPSLAAEMRTPTLRAVARTAPYMHDGRFATLADVLDHYDRTAEPLGLCRWTAEQRADVLAFLATL